MNPLQSQTEKASRFQKAGMWKLSLDVENEPPAKIERPVKNEAAR